MNYDAAHYSLRKARGLASAYACVNCDAQARDWSYQYNAGADELTEGRRRYSANPDHYVPMCRRCHKAFDAEHDPSITEALAASGRRNIVHCLEVKAERLATDPEYAARVADHARTMWTPEGSLAGGLAVMEKIGPEQWSENASRGGTTVSKQTRECECGLISNPGAVGRHLSATGHSLK